MLDVEEKGTVDISAEVATETNKIPTIEYVRSKGWTDKEIESAQKRGMIQKVEEEKVDDSKDVKKEPLEEMKDDVKKEDVDAMVRAGVDLTPDQEAQFLKNRPAGNADRGFYFRMKNERRGRQAAQEEAKREREARLALEAKIAENEGKKSKVLDENGEEISEDEKPLTLKDLKAMREKEEAEYVKSLEQNKARASIVSDAQIAQEEYAKTIYTDFDETANKAKDVISNLDKLIPEKWKQVKIVKLIRELQTAAANADKLDCDDYNAAHIAYEIGTYHPEYGKKNGAKPVETGTPKSPKVNGGLTPEQMKRVEENTQRRASSGSIPGGGAKRSISPEDVGLSELNAMNYMERKSFREKHPDRYTKIIRG